MRMHGRLGVAVLAAGIALQFPFVASAGESSFEIYGFAMVDYIQDFGRVNPDWEDTLRPSRIPTDDEQFGGDGNASLSVKQSRLGFQANLPTGGGDIYTKFEIDMFGVGSDAGETTIRLRHAYGEYGAFLAGQTHSLFMDINMFPNTIDYWGPAGMVFLRNPQIRWTPLKGDSTFAIAIENPGNDIDSGQFREVADFPGAQGKQDLPDFTARWRQKTGFGHVQLAGILRSIGAEVICDPGQTDANALNYCPSGAGGKTEVIFDDDAIGWGLNLTTVVNLLERDALRVGLVHGEGIASYMNDGGMDAGPDRPVGSPGVQVEAVELTGFTGFYDHWWNSRWSSSAGYSFTEVDNTAGQTPDTFKKGQYALVNLLHYPADKVMMGIEFLWGEREDLNGASNDDTRIQVSFKYNFSSNDFLKAN